MIEIVLGIIVAVVVIYAAILVLSIAGAAISWFIYIVVDGIASIKEGLTGQKRKQR
jgi:dolichol kinase